MNQSILFNDDLTFNEKVNAWHFTGLLNGELITVQIDEKCHHRTKQVTDSIKFDWEDAVEIWLEDNEPNEFGYIQLIL